MGRRKKAAKKVVKKKRPVLSKAFKCLFCANDKSVVCTINLSKSKTGLLKCTMCDARFERPVSNLTGPIDLYHQWLDEAAAAQERESSAFLQQSGISFSRSDDNDGHDTGLGEDD